MSRCLKSLCFGLDVAKIFSLGFQELERQKHTCTVLQHKQEELKEGIQQRDELIEVKNKKITHPHSKTHQFYHSSGSSVSSWKA